MYGLTNIAKCIILLLITRLRSDATRKRSKRCFHASHFVALKEKFSGGAISMMYV